MGREHIGMRISPEIIKAIDIIAKEQNRNRSNTIEWLLTEWLREHRHELFQPVIQEAVMRVFISEETDKEAVESMELLAYMPAEEVADAIDATRDIPIPGKGRPKKEK